jgi:hypothetical protein
MVKRFKKVTVKNDGQMLDIVMPSGIQHRISVFDNGSILIHSLSGDTTRVSIGAGDNSFKVNRVNRNGTVYSIEKINS